MEMIEAKWFVLTLVVIFAIGLASILLWIMKQAAKLFVPKAIPQDSSSAPATFIRVGHEGVLTNINDLPQYKGRVGLFWLPVYADVIVPDKHNYATVVYMDNPVKQWVYDWMSSWKGAADTKENPHGTLSLVVFLVIPFLFNKFLGMAILGSAILLFLFGAPSGKRAVRRMAENAKDFTPNDWRKIYKDIAESKEREDEMVRAFRRSGHW